MKCSNYFIFFEFNASAYLYLILFKSYKYFLVEYAHLEYGIWSCKICFQILSQFNYLNRIKLFPKKREMLPLFLNALQNQKNKSQIYYSIVLLGIKNKQLQLL